ncbi:MAG: hypothetical protein AB1556_08455 [Bacillota bacterium]
MSEMYPGKAVLPQIICLGRGIKIAPGDAVELECPRASILNVAFRINASGPVSVTVEEYQDNTWRGTEMLEACEGETVWHHILKRAVFRLRLTNPSREQDVTVSVDANLPCRI